jgi:hypothetical protein
LSCLFSLSTNSTLNLLDLIFNNRVLFDPLRRRTTAAWSFYNTSFGRYSSPLWQATATTPQWSHSYGSVRRIQHHSWTTVCRAVC